MADPGFVYRPFKSGGRLAGRARASLSDPATVKAPKKTADEVATSKPGSLVQSTEPAQTNSAEKPSDGGGVQFPLVDRDQVRNRVRVPATEQSVGDIAKGGALGSDSRERPATIAVDALLGKLAAKLPKAEANKLKKFITRLERERVANRHRQKAFRDRKREAKV